MNIRQLTLATLISFTSLTACDRLYSKSAQDHIENAKVFETKGDLKTSILELKSAVQKEPDNAQARWLLGQLYLKTGQGAESEKELNRAVQAGVNEASIKPLLAHALLLQGEHQRLLNEIALNGRENASIKASILSSMASANFGLGKFEEGCNLFSESHKSDASHLPAYRGLANCDNLKGKTIEAKARLQEALKIDPKDADTWTLLGDFEQFNKNKQAAITAYAEALKHHPKHIQALYKHGELSLMTGNTDAAKKDLADIRNADPSHYLGHFLQALLHYKADKTEAAIESTARTLKIQPKHLPAYYLLGVLQYNKKSYEQAAKTLSLYSRAAPGDMDARKILAAAYLKLGEPEKTLETIKPILAVKTDDAQLFALAAEAYALQKDPQSATQLFEKASELVPTDASLLTELGLTRLQAGEKERAEEALRKAAKQDPKYLKSSYALAINFLRDRKPKEALMALAEVEKSSPDIPALHNLKGVAYGSLKDTANARKSFERALTLDTEYLSAARNLANIDLSEGKPEAARKRFIAILDRDKNNTGAMVSLAQLSAREKKETDFVMWLEKAAKTDAKAIQPRQLLAGHYVNQRQFQKALATAREAMNANPDSTIALSFLGAIQMAAGEKDNALASYNKLVATAPDSPHAHYRLGLAQQAMNQTVAAKQSLKTALTKKTDFLPALRALVALEITAKHFEDALLAAQQVQKLHPQSPDGLALEGSVHLAAKAYAKAVEAYKKAYTLGQSNSLLVNYHQALSLSGDEKAAEGMIQQWLTKQPEDLFVRAYLARHYLHIGEKPEAIAAHEWLLDKAPRDVRLLNNLAWLYQQTGDARALPMAEQAYKRAPQSPAIQDTLGWLLVQKGDLNRGRDLLGKASAKTASPSVHYHYGVALAKTGDKVGARRELNTILAPGKPSFDEKPLAEALLKSL